MAAPLAAPPLLEDDWDDMSRFKLHDTGSCSERRRRRRDDDDDDDDDDDIMEQDVGLTEQQKQQQHGVEVVVDLMDVLLDLKHDDTGCCFEERNNKTMDTCFKSTTEELMMMVVTDVDGRLSVCLTDDGGDDLIISTAPVSLITEETLLERDQLWRDLTDNFGRVMPLDWKRSRARTLHLAAMFSQPQQTRACEELVDLFDDEELREQLDMHSIIVSCLNDEPLFTAEQVIEEIEELMQDSVEQAADQNPSQSELSVFSMELLTSSNTHCYEDKLRAMSLAELNEHLEEVDATIRSFSEELIVQLALRDELDFEKEVKEAFISVLIAVHNRQKEHRELQRKQKKTKSGAERAERAAHTLGSRFSMDGLSAAIQNGFRQTFGSGANERQYLTTVIPYEKKAGPPSIQDLQVLTQILQAMLEDSDKVPSLLTDYILKVVCPPR